MFDLIFHPRHFFKNRSFENGKLNLVYLFMPLFLIYLSPFVGWTSPNLVGVVESNLLILVLYFLFFLYSAGFYKLTMARKLGWEFFASFPSTFLPFILLPISLTLSDLNFHTVSIAVTIVSVVWSFTLENLMFKELMKNYSIGYHIFMKVAKDLPMVLFMYGGMFRG